MSSRSIGCHRLQWAHQPKRKSRRVALRVMIYKICLIKVLFRVITAGCFGWSSRGTPARWSYWDHSRSSGPCVEFSHQISASNHQCQSVLQNSLVSHVWFNASFLSPPQHMLFQEWAKDEGNLHRLLMSKILTAHGRTESARQVRWLSLSLNMYHTATTFATISSHEFSHQEKRFQYGKVETPCIPHLWGQPWLVVCRKFLPSADKLYRLGSRSMGLTNGHVRSDSPRRPIACLHTLRQLLD